ncbi:efflux RND transporter periplasmic adaptor subunit [Staphylococcus coagulans]
MVANNEQVRAGTQLINLATSSDRQNILNQISEIQTKINENYNQLNKSPNDPGILNDLAVNQKKYTGLENELYKYDREIYRRTHAIFDGKVKVLNENALDDKKPIVRLISNDTKIETVVSEYDLEKIQEGDSVNVKVTANGKKGKGKISYIFTLPEELGNPSSNSKENNNSLEEISTTDTDNSISKYKVIISDLNIPVNPGYTIEGEIPTNKIKLPKNVIVRDSYVFVLDSKNRVERRKIKIEKINGEIILKKGLKKGEVLIENPKPNLNDGDKVEVEHD